MSDNPIWQWTDAHALCVEGQAWTDTKEPFARLPARAEGKVRDVIWQLGRHATGITIGFESDAVELRARWSLANHQLSSPYTPLFAASGLDLYAAAPTGQWRWVGITKEISGQQAETVLTNWGALASGWHQFRLYLPIFNPVLKLEIGVPSGASIRAAPPRSEKPIVYYGTSIVHGVGVSRPGMTHVAQLSRRLNYPFVNLGFSGNAHMEPEVAALLAELEPALFIIDALPNMNASLITERAAAFVQTLATARPGTPIVLVEDRAYPAGWITPSAQAIDASNRAAFKAVYGKLLTAGVGPLHYIEGNGLLGLDGDGTSDGSHPNDLGATRLADALEPVLRALLTKYVH